MRALVLPADLLRSIRERIADIDARVQSREATGADLRSRLEQRRSEHAATVAEIVRRESSVNPADDAAVAELAKLRAIADLLAKQIATLEGELDAWQGEAVCLHVGELLKELGTAHRAALEEALLGEFRCVATSESEAQQMVRKSGALEFSQHFIKWANYYAPREATESALAEVRAIFRRALAGAARLRSDTVAAVEPLAPAVEPVFES